MSDEVAVVEDEQHHRYSASGSEGWMACPGKVAMEHGKDEKYSAYADEGSAAHFLAAESLTNDVTTIEYFGRYIVCYQLGDRSYQCFAETELPEGSVETSRWEVTRDMAYQVQRYVDQVRDDAKDGVLMVEQRVEFGPAIGLPGAFGTGDAVILSNDGKTIKVRDLKYGFKPVSAFENKQMMLYALGSLHDFDYLIDPDVLQKVDLKIIQPRIGAPDEEWVTTPEYLDEFAEQAKEAVQRSEEALKWFRRMPMDQWSKQYLNPSEKGCGWCKAKYECKAFAEEAMEPVAELANIDGLMDLDIPDLDTAMDTALQQIPEIEFEQLVRLYSVHKKLEMFVDAIKDRMLYDMLKGHKTPHFKLVRGRQGNRKWSSEAEAEAAMKAMRFKVDEMYDKKVISPPDAEKLMAVSPRKWKNMKPLIIRADGKIAVAPMNDKRDSFDPYGEQLVGIPDLNKVDIDDLI